MKSAGRFLVAVLGVTLATPVLACSICRCGDPTFNALGKEGIAQSGLRLAVDWEWVKKTQGIPGDEFDSLREERSTLLIAYGLSDAAGVFVRLPYSRRELAETEAGVTNLARNAGFADPELYGQLRLWHSNFAGDVGVRSSVYAIVGLKTDWGSNDAARDGERLDEHVQSGTGSTDWFTGVSASYQVDRRSAIFASAQYRHTGRNDFGYRYGRVTLLNLAYEHKIGRRWDAVMEANFRHAGSDQVDASGAVAPDTGGSIAYLTPRILFDIGGGWVVRASAQLPVSNSGLHGHEDEKPVLNLGITWLVPD